MCDTQSFGQQCGFGLCHVRKGWFDKVLHGYCCQGVVS